MRKSSIFYLYLLLTFFVFFESRASFALQSNQNWIGEANRLGFSFFFSFRPDESFNKYNIGKRAIFEPYISPPFQSIREVLMPPEEAKKAEAQVNIKVKTFVSLLSEEQRSILAGFLKMIIGESLSGYVIFGDKPLCIEGWSLEEEEAILSGFNPDQLLYTKWQDLWENLEISPENKEYLFLSFDVDYGCRHLICINRKAFIQTVNDNITLFRYVLGPTLTAEQLLDQLIHSKSRFYDVLKDDNVLLGILLGYGRQNALLVSREELISDAFVKDREEDFPYIARKARFLQKKLPKIQSKRPSIGYDCLADESNILNEKTKVSTHLKPFKICSLPYFACEPSSQETQVLLNTYEANRSLILKTLDDPLFLEKTLTKLLTTTSNKIEIPTIPSSQPSFSNLSNQDQLIEKLIDRVYQEIKMNAYYFHEDYLTSFLEGVKAKQNSIVLGSPSRIDLMNSLNIYHIEQDFKRIKNLEISNAFFNNLESQNGMISLIPKKLCYKTIRKGEGKTLSRTSPNASFHYSCKILSDSILTEDVGTVKEESLEFFIPGISLSLIGMQIGEIREVYIHPEYGYGEDSYLPPNLTIVAKIELLNFLDSPSDSPTEIAIAPSHQIPERNHQELLEKYQKLCRDEFYWRGAHFWHEMQKTKQVDFDIFVKHFLSFKSSGLAAAFPGQPD